MVVVVFDMVEDCSLVGWGLVGEFEVGGVVSGGCLSVYDCFLFFGGWFCFCCLVMDI